MTTVVLGELTLPSPAVKNQECMTLACRLSYANELNSSFDKKETIGVVRRVLTHQGTKHLIVTSIDKQKRL